LKTFVFIGSDKNAGKTTAFNFIASQLDAKQQLIFSSIGMNGENSDQYEKGQIKPSIQVSQGQLCVTAYEHLRYLKAPYEILQIFSAPYFLKKYVLIKVLYQGLIVLEGPNTGGELVLLKEKLAQLYPDSYFLLDGSIDRQFIGSPEISDGIYFSLLVSARDTQLSKARDLLRPFFFKCLDDKSRQLILKNKRGTERSLLLTREGEVLHMGTISPFLDRALEMKVEQYCEQELLLYLDGALTKSLYRKWMPLSRLQIVLDRFTLYQNVNTEGDDFFRGEERIHILHSIPLLGVFLKEEAVLRLPLPDNIPIFNIYRENHYAIRDRARESFQHFE